MSIREETEYLLGRLGRVADRLLSKGYTDAGSSAAPEAARMAANSVFPLRLFTEWLDRSPEAQAAVLDALDEFRNNTTGAADFERIHQEATAAGLKTPAIYPTQKSEPSGEPGIKGARAESITVNIGNAATILGKGDFTTRPVNPTDLNGLAGLGEVPGFAGQKPVPGADEQPLRARARFRGEPKPVVVEFMAKKGPLLMMRITEGQHKGHTVTGPIEWIDPASRAAVLTAFDGFPGADDEFNFSPFDGESDPWATPPA